ncbi:MAG: YHS domain-containing protein, partial [Planctomycetes bacterium]|nr:YHS domain-containing protein [Planctomycetota bacterium]
GTSTVSYKGETFYVCCSGCRDAFNENPEKYVKEFKAKKGKN